MATKKVKVDEETTKEIIRTKKGTIDGRTKGNNPNGAAGKLMVKEGDNTRYLRHALNNASLPAIDISDKKAVEDRVNWYFEKCIEDDVKPTVSGLANSLGVGRSTLYNWSVGETRGATHLDVIKRAYRILDELWQHYMQNGKINPVSGIFLGKNMFGYADKSEVVVSPKDPLGEKADAEEIRERYLESNIIDIDED